MNLALKPGSPLPAVPPSTSSHRQSAPPFLHFGRPDNGLALLLRELTAAEPVRNLLVRRAHLLPGGPFKLRFHVHPSGLGVGAEHGADLP